MRKKHVITLFTVLAMALNLVLGTMPGRCSCMLLMRKLNGG